jgi:tetratricopeptide (TPR) repeat protein
MVGMHPLERRPAVAALLVLLAAAAASAEEPAPPAPPPAPPAGRSTPNPPDTIEKAYLRLESLRRTPLTGPGAVVRRKERVRGLADAALAIHAKTPAAGEDLFRLAEICTDAEQPAEAAKFAAAYLGSGDGKAALPNEGPARALEIRGFAAQGRLAEADAALKAWAEKAPTAEGLGPVGKSVGDAWLEAGKPADALSRYREAHARLPRPFKPGAAATVQALVEALAFHGEIEEARKVLDRGVEDARGDEATGHRFAAVRRRLDLFGTKFPAPPLDRWLGGAAPTEADLKGRVAVWHLFGWWTAARPLPLEGWIARLGEWASKGLVVLPVTRTSGWDPAQSRFRSDRKPVDELPDLEKAVREIGWKGAVGVSFDGALFNALSVRGLPMEVVVGRDGRVVYCQAGSEPGHRFAMLAAERALAAPASPEAPAGGR